MTDGEQSSRRLSATAAKPLHVRPSEKGSEAPSAPFGSSDSARIPARHEVSQTSVAGSASPLAGTAAAGSQEPVPGPGSAASVHAGFETGVQPEQHDPGPATCARQSVPARMASPFAVRAASPFASQLRMVSPFASEVATPFTNSSRSLNAGLSPASSGPAALAGDPPDPGPQLPGSALPLARLGPPVGHQPGSTPQLAPLQQPPRSLRSTASASGVTLESPVTDDLCGDSPPPERQQEQPPGEEREPSPESAAAGSGMLTHTSSGKASNPRAMSMRGSYSEAERLATLQALGLPRPPSGGHTACSGAAA